MAVIFCSARPRCLSANTKALIGDSIMAQILRTPDSTNALYLAVVLYPQKRFTGQRSGV